MKHLVVLTGAGISAESGIKTFREMGGLWEEYDITEVASPEGWDKNPQLVLDFYNQRRKELYEKEPNKAHFLLKELESDFKVSIITQNVDDLHERAGSTNVLHLHGELKKVRSTLDETDVKILDGWELKYGDKCPKGGQYRPHIVWFGEEVPMMEKAIEIAIKADIFLIVGTSLNVYPAAGLVNHTTPGIPIWLIDPNEITSGLPGNINIIKGKASIGMQEFIKKIKSIE